jgi:hypothetical protein
MKDVMNDNHTTESPENLVDWLRRVEIVYRSIAHIIDTVRDNDISSTSYVTRFDAYYAMAIGMLDFLFSPKMSPTDEILEYKVKFDTTIGKYVSNDEHWKQTQVEINEALMMLRSEQASFDIKPEKEIEQKYLKELVSPVNRLLDEYLVEQAKDDDIVYALTYNAMRSDLFLNDIKIYHAKMSGADTVLNDAFDQTGPIKKVVSKQAGINTGSIINNIKMPKNLRSYMLNSHSNYKGITITSVVTRADIAREHIDTYEVNNWLKSLAEK